MSFYEILAFAAFGLFMFGGFLMLQAIRSQDAIHKGLGWAAFGAAAATGVICLLVYSGVLYLN